MKRSLADEFVAAPDRDSRRAVLARVAPEAAAWASFSDSIDGRCADGVFAESVHYMTQAMAAEKPLEDPVDAEKPVEDPADATASGHVIDEMIPDGQALVRSYRRFFEQPT